MEQHDIIKWLLGAVVSLLGLHNANLEFRLRKFDTAIGQKADKSDVKDGIARIERMLERIEDRMNYGGKGNTD